MNGKIMKITKVEIKGLWNRFDLSWDLHPDVNVLSGINGSGKSTILQCVAQLILTGQLPDNIKNVVRSVNVIFDNGKSLFYGENEADNTVSDSTQRVIPGSDFDAKVELISTFDNEILEVGRRPDQQVRTELDRDIFRLQKQYLDYQLNISKKTFEIVKQYNGHSQEKVMEVMRQQERFLEIIDYLFKDTDKKINREKNEIVFVSGSDEISAYDLSSGEKQILVILLTVLVQDNKPLILFMDEPEISLHFDWQKKLIQYIREINANVQIILATHSPAIIIEGWGNKVAEVRDLLTFDRLKAVQ